MKVLKSRECIADGWNKCNRYGDPAQWTRLTALCFLWSFLQGVASTKSQRFSSVFLFLERPTPDLQQDLELFMWYWSGRSTYRERERERIRTDDNWYVCPFARVQWRYEQEEIQSLRPANKQLEDVMHPTSNDRCRRKRRFGMLRLEWVSFACRP